MKPQYDYYPSQSQRAALVGVLLLLLPVLYPNLFSPLGRASPSMFSLFAEVDVKIVFKEVTTKFLRRRIVEGERSDGRTPYETRPINSRSLENNLLTGSIPANLWQKTSFPTSSRLTLDLKQMVKEVTFSGMLSNTQNFNPDFYNWNRIKVRYCDGASFTSDVEAVNPATNLHFRGARVWLAIIEDLLAKGMKNAENAILSGCSAGGLTSILHCDRFRSLLPLRTKVKCLSDAGYFINAKDVSGAQHIETFYSEVVATHGSAKNLPPSCTSRLRPGLCFFPQYVAPQIQTPIFFVNAAYDSWQRFKKLLLFSGNDYLGLSSHPAVDPNPLKQIPC